MLSGFCEAQVPQDSLLQICMGGQQAMSSLKLSKGWQSAPEMAVRAGSLHFLPL